MNLNYVNTITSIFILFSFTVEGQLQTELVTNPEYKPGWNLVFHDEFNGTSLDLSKWKTFVGVSGENPKNTDDYERAYFSSAPHNVVISDGTLKLICVKEQITAGYWKYDENGDPKYYTHDFEYTSGRIDTQEPYDYGYYEVKCKLPKGDGYWPAFWNYNGAPNPEIEIDFYENKLWGGEFKVGTNYHVGNKVNPSCTTNCVKIDPACEDPTTDLYEIDITHNITEEFITVGTDWTEDDLFWYVNNTLGRGPVNHRCGLKPENSAFIILGVGIDGVDNGHHLLSMNAQNRFPGAYEVDYVRYYKRACEEQQAIFDYGVQHGYTNQNIRPRMFGDFNGDGMADLIAFGYQWTRTSFGQSDGTLGPMVEQIQDFTVEQAFITQNERPRLIGDVNGDGYDDIVAFGDPWTTVNLGNSNGTFGSKIYAIQDYTRSQGYIDQNLNPRFLADVNGDGRDDIIAFGNLDIYVSLGQLNGTFGAATFVLQDYTLSQGWTNQQERPRKIGDINGDGMADIIGFGWTHTTVCLGQLNGMFGQKLYVATNFTREQGYTTQEERPRMIADVNGDGYDDIVAFGTLTTAVSLGQNNGYVLPPTSVATNFTKEQGWHTLDEFPRMLADVNGDCMADIVGFGGGETKIAISTSTASIPIFNEYQNVTREFSFTDGYLSQNEHPRFVCDITGDGNNDIVGIADLGVRTLSCLNTTQNQCPSSAITRTQRKRRDENVPPELSDKNSHIEIFPNPSKEGIFNLRFSTDISIHSLRVINNLGEEVRPTLTNLQTGLIDLSNCRSGVYTIIINDDIGNQWSKKIIKL